MLLGSTNIMKNSYPCSIAIDGTGQQFGASIEPQVSWLETWIPKSSVESRILYRIRPVKCI